VSGIGTLLAFVAALALLVQERNARGRAEAAGRKRHELTVVRDLHRQLKPIVSHLLGAHDEGKVRAWCREIRTAIDSRAFEVSDEEVRGRLRAVELVAFTVAWGEEQWMEESGGRDHPFSWPLGVMRLRMMLERVVWSLESYIKGDTLPMWDDELPPSVAAQAWALSGRKSCIEDEAGG
jgi:hypothetical protein